MSNWDDEEDLFGDQKKLREFFDDNEDWLDEKDDVLKNKKSVGTELDEDGFDDYTGLFRDDKEDLDNRNDDYIDSRKTILGLNQSSRNVIDGLAGNKDSPTHEIEDRIMKDAIHETESELEPIYIKGKYPNKGKSWIQSHEEFLRKNANRPYKELEPYLGRSARSIKQKWHTMQGTPSKPAAKRERWTQKKKEYVEEHMDHKSAIEISNDTEKSVNAVRMMIARLRGSSLDYEFTKNENEFIFEYSLRKSDSELASEIGIHLNTLHKQRVNAGKIRINDPQFTDSDLALDPRNITKDGPKIRKLYFGDLNGMKKIGEIINRGPDSFKHEILDTGAQIVEPGLTTKVMNHFSGKYNIKLSPERKEIFIGCLLGDIQIRNSSELNPNYPVLNIEKYEEMINGIQEIRKQALLNNPLLIRDINVWNSGIDKINDTNTAMFRVNKSIQEHKWVKTLASYLSDDYAIKGDVTPVNNLEQALQWNATFYTNSSTQLGYIWQEWYEPKPIFDDGLHNKILPDSLETLTPNIVLHWYTGDATFSRNAHSFSSENFKLSEQKLLVRRLSEVGIKSTIYQGGDGPYIGIKTARKNQKHFFEFLSNAKFYEDAKEFLPHKFDKDLTHKSIIDNLRKERPEFFDPNAKITWDEL